MATRRISAAFIALATADHRPESCFVHGRLCSPEKVDRVLHVPGLPSRDGTPRHADSAETERTEEFRDAQYHSDVHLRVAYETSASDRLGTRLELGLDEQYRLPQRRRGREEALQSDGQRDEREVGHQKIGVERQILSRQSSHVGPL